MKALSLTQPWATLIALGAKQIETRSWETTYRGELAIHASKAFPGDCAILCEHEPFRSAMLGASWKALPLGAILAVVELTIIKPTEELQWFLSPQERAFGDYRSKRYAWRLEHVHALRRPVPCRGALSIWSVPSDIARAVREELR